MHPKTGTMIKITIIDREDTKHPIEVPTDMGLNLMEVCKASDLPVLGTCGGMALCSTCHVYVVEGDNLPDPSDAEEDMLDQAFFVEENSRLGCQLTISDALDGMVFKLAPAAE